MSIKAISSVVLTFGFLLLGTQEARAACPGVLAQNEVISADNIFWLEVPHVTDVLGAKKSSTVAAMLNTLVPGDIRNSILKISPTSFLYTTYRGPSGQPQEASVLVDGSCATDLAKLAQEWVKTLADPSLAPVSYPGRVGFATQSRVQQINQRALSTLAQSADYLSLQKHAALVRGRLSLVNLFGWLARQPNGRETAGIVERLGLLSAQALTFFGQADSLQWTLSMQNATQGLLAAAGPAIVHERPNFVPKDAVGFARASVRPNQLLTVIQLVTAYQWPMESAVVRANLDAAQTRAGKHLGEDVLGDAPQTLTFYQVPASRGLATVVDLTVKDAQAGEAFVQGLGILLPAFAKGAKLVESKVVGARVLTLSPGSNRSLGEVHVAFKGQAMVVATDLSALKRHLSAKGKSTRLSNESLVAYGYGHGATMPFVGVPLAGLGQVNWQVAKDEKGLSGSLQLPAK